MGGRGGAGGALGAVLRSSKRTITISGSVYFDDGVHVPTTHRQREIPSLLSGLNDVIIQVNNDNRGQRQLKDILDNGFYVVRSYTQRKNVPYLRNFYYIKRRGK